MKEATKVIRAAPNGTKGRQMAKNSSAVRAPEIGAHAQSLERHEPEHEHEGGETDGERQAHVGAGRQNLAADQALRATGRLSSASSEPRSRSPAVESIARYSPPISTENSTKYVMKPSTTTARPVGVATSISLTATGTREQRTHAADLQPQLRDAAAIGPDERPQPIGALAGLRIRAVGDQQHGAGQRRGEARREFVRHDQHHLRRAALHGGARVAPPTGGEREPHALRFEIAHEARARARRPRS